METVLNYNVPDGMDDDSALLILKLQNEEVKELMDKKKGKRKHSEISDAELAIEIYQKDLQDRITILSDQRMSRSICQAVTSDAALLSEHRARENTIVQDRALAYRLAGRVPPPLRPEQATGEDALDDGMMARLAAGYIPGRINVTEQDNDLAAAESSSWALSRRNPLVETRHCIACDSIKTPFDICRTPCGHYYCVECLSTLFQLSTTDETLFPPRCCRQLIPLRRARLYLSSTLIRTFEEKSVEFLSSNRTYCSQPTCSSFISSDNIDGEKATCRACGTQTCTICKNQAHDNDCPEDTGTQQVIETGREQGWQRCYRCRSLVELDMGCNHITCICGAQFCYVCGQPWKNCRCPQWVEDRLVARANQVVLRDPPRDGVLRDGQVNQAIADLRDRHNCAHREWSRLRGPRRCELCHQNLPSYILECEQCRIRVCGRCQHNRL